MVYCCCVADALSNIAIWVDVSEDLFELTLLDLREETEPRLPRFPLLLPVLPPPRRPLAQFALANDSALVVRQGPGNLSTITSGGLLRRLTKVSQLHNHSVLALSDSVSILLRLVVTISIPIQDLEVHQRLVPL